MGRSAADEPCGGCATLERERQRQGWVNRKARGSPLAQALSRIGRTALARVFDAYGKKQGQHDLRDAARRAT